MRTKKLMLQQNVPGSAPYSLGASSRPSVTNKMESSVSGKSDTMASFPSSVVLSSASRRSSEGGAEPISGASWGAAGRGRGGAGGAAARAAGVACREGKGEGVKLRGGGAASGLKLYALSP